MNELKNKYFDWIFKRVCNKKYTHGRSYRKLCHALDNIEFTYTIPMDSNRYDDGVELRYRYGYDHNLDGAEIMHELDRFPCSVFEMMAALAIRCEEHIMADPELGDQTSLWFMEMISNLGLDYMSDEMFNEQEVDNAVARLLTRQYEPDGRGGLFITHDPDRDLRHVDIWYQAMWHLTDVINDEMGPTWF